MKYMSEGDERAFFNWLQAIPCVIGVRGSGRELHIRLKSRRLSQNDLREFIALYGRYGGRMAELAQFANASNQSWFCSPAASWHSKVFAAPQKPNQSLEPTRVGKPPLAAQLQR